jgi:flagellar basal-body rod modification protein FlgD
MSTTAIPPTSSSAATAATANNAFQNLTPTDFVQMLVTQLQNQDPLNPTSSQDILTQVSQIGQLSSSTQLQTTLTGLSQNNQIGAASSLIGKEVSGIDSANNSATGVVTSVAVASTGVTLNLDSGDSLSLTNITSISAAPAASASAMAETAQPNAVTSVMGSTPAS